MKQILTCTGYGTTGSSAATNILEEFSDVKSLSDNFECTFLHEADGLRDLEHALCEGHRLKTDLAIKRFLRLADALNKNIFYIKCFNGKFKKHSCAFIDSLCTAQWKGAWHRSSDTMSYSKQDLLYYNLARQVFLHEYSYSHYHLFEPNGWRPCYYLRNKTYYAHFDASFYQKARNYVTALLHECTRHTDAKNILIDQFFPAYDIASYLKYAPQTKTIIVDRDPRDMYVLNKSSWGEAYIPTENIDTFIQWYRGIRFSQKKEAENAQVLLCRFEDFIFNYESSLNRLMQFAGLEKSEHTKKLQRFNPEKSIKNTNRFTHFPKWKADIQKIEEELSEYCYHFPDSCSGALGNKRTGISRNQCDAALRTDCSGGVSHNDCTDSSYTGCSAALHNGCSAASDTRCADASNIGCAGISESVYNTDVYIEDFIQQADTIRAEKKLPPHYKPMLSGFLFGMTRFGSAFMSLLRRGPVQLKLKGIIKCLVFFPTFIFEYVYALFIYFKWR